MTDRFTELKEKIFRLGRELCEAKIELQKVCPHKEWYETKTGETISDVYVYRNVYVHCIECGKCKPATGKENLVPKPWGR